MDKSIESSNYQNECAELLNKLREAQNKDDVVESAEGITRWLRDVDKHFIRWQSRYRQ